MNYFNDKTLVTNSMLGRLLADENKFTAWMNGRYEYKQTPEMIFGSATHGMLFEYLSGGAYVDDFYFKIVKDYKLNSKSGKEYFAEHVEPLIGAGIPTLKEKDWESVKWLIGTAKNDEFLKAYIDYLRGEYALSFEEVFTGTINGVAVKSKMDIVCRDLDGNVRKIIDYKTTSDINKFRVSARVYGYDRQSVMYSRIVGLNLTDDVFDFLVQDKNTGNIRLFKTYSHSFASRAGYKLTHALNKFKEWQNNDTMSLKTVVLD